MPAPRARHARRGAGTPSSRSSRRPRARCGATPVATAIAAFCTAAVERRAAHVHGRAVRHGRRCRGSRRAPRPSCSRAAGRCRRCRRSVRPGVGDRGSCATSSISSTGSSSAPAHVVGLADPDDRRPDVRSARCLDRAPGRPPRAARQLRCVTSLTAGSARTRRRTARRSPLRSLGVAAEELVGVRAECRRRPSRYARCSRNDATPASSVPVTSTACVGRGGASPRRSARPDHGSRPSSSSSVNTHRLPASRAASSARDRRRPGGRPCSAAEPRTQLVVDREHEHVGRCRRIARARSRRRSQPVLEHAVAVVEELDASSTPTCAAPARSSSRRSGPASAGSHAVDAGLDRRSPARSRPACPGRSSGRPRSPRRTPGRRGGRRREGPVPVLGERLELSGAHVAANLAR